MSENLTLPSDFSPAWAVPPGSLIRRELEIGGFSQADVALRTNLSAKHLNQLLMGHVPLSPEVGLALERVLGTPAELWLRMDVSWQAHKTRAAAAAALSDAGAWVRQFPNTVLRSIGGFDAKATISSQVESLLRFFQVTDTRAFERVWLEPQANYKRSQAFEIDKYATALWLRMAEVKAEDQLGGLPQYDAGALRELVREIPSLTTKPLSKGFRKAQKILGRAGVVLVFVPEIDGTRICGASRWLGSGHPVVALSGRHKFHDIFWFTLLHEIGHVLLHPKRSTYLDVERKGGGSADDETVELAANDFAEDVLLTAKERDELVSIDDAETLAKFADRVSLSLGVVAGQYAHLTKDWKSFGKLRVSSNIAQDLAA